MKIDTEGSELFILRGAQKMIHRDHPIILMEYNETNMKQCYVNKHEIDTFLREMNYKWELVSHEDILCKSRSCKQPLATQDDKNIQKKIACIYY